ncbi:Alginate regulatory protein AlgP [Minicystis rosea]|nr:Alginate regulatory protein AlgP [Minicystis rosea]
METKDAISMQPALDLVCRPVLSSHAIMTTAEKLKVLIAEDEPAMLSLVSRHAKSLGFSVVEASDGDAAWEMAQKHHPDLVLLDVMMPGMSGWEVCKRIKSNTAAFGHTGVIMLTGIGESLNDMTSPLFKADGWLNKPFDFADLDAKVREVLELHDRELPSAHADEDLEAAPAKKPAAKKAAKKPAAKKPAAKPAAKKPAAKKSAAKKTAAKKPAAKKPAAKKAAKKTVAKKAAPQKAAAKKPAAKKSAAKKTAAKKTATRRRA